MSALGDMIRDYEKKIDELTFENTRLVEIFECIQRNSNNNWILERCDEALNPKFEC